MPTACRGTTAWRRRRRQAAPPGSEAPGSPRRRERRSTGSAARGPWSAPGCSSRPRSEEHTSELQSQSNLVCRLLLEKKKQTDPASPSSTPPPYATKLAIVDEHTNKHLKLASNHARS